jgi:hypothetical protein
MWRIVRKDGAHDRSTETYGYAITNRGADRMIKKAPKSSSCGFTDFWYSKEKVKLGVMASS